MSFKIENIDPGYFINTLPRGTIGSIAQYIYDQAPRPVREIALAGALGLFAGIVGRQYNYSGTGLNQYLMMIARTGRGKEAMASGIAKIVKELEGKVPFAADIRGPAEIASGQALLKYLSEIKVPCAVSVIAEIGLKLQQLTHPKAHGAEIMLLKVLLDLFAKSGAGNSIMPSIYADRKNNTQSINSPAFTILGDSTGETFYGALDERQVAMGLLPRFTIIEYDGPRVALNKTHSNTVVPIQLITDLEEKFLHCHRLATSNKVEVVNATPEAEAMMDAIDTYATNIINSPDQNRAVSEVYNRVDMKIKRIAALLAVSDDHQHPTIDSEMVKWATSLVITDAQRLVGKFSKGEIGVSDESDNTKQIEVIKHAVTKYVSIREFWMLPISRSTTPEMHANAVLPYVYIQRTVIGMAAFRKDRRGATHAINSTLKTMCDMGWLQELPSNQMRSRFGNGGKGYCIANVQAFIDPTA